jgi:hypothetical protein
MNCVFLDEPLDADPHVRWCEMGRLVPAPYSIPKKWCEQACVHFTRTPFMQLC